MGLGPRGTDPEISSEPIGVLGTGFREGACGGPSRMIGTRQVPIILLDGRERRVRLYFTAGSRLIELGATGVSCPSHEKAGSEFYPNSRLPQWAGSWWQSCKKAAVVGGSGLMTQVDLAIMNIFEA